MSVKCECVILTGQYNSSSFFPSFPRAVVETNRLGLMGLGSCCGWLWLLPAGGVSLTGRCLGVASEEEQEEDMSGLRGELVPPLLTWWFFLDHITDKIVAFAMTVAETIHITANS